MTTHTHSAGYSSRVQRIMRFKFSKEQEKNGSSKKTNEAETKNTAVEGLRLSCSLFLL